MKFALVINFEKEPKIREKEREQSQLKCSYVYFKQNNFSFDYY
jgi:hypothetical protein